MKYSNLKKIFLSLLIFCACAICASALSVPELTGPVVDKANLLTVYDFQTLSTELVNISEQTGTQIAVLTVPSLEGEALESYSMRVCEEWKLGSKKNDDGVLLLIAFNEKKIRIEVGYGLEGQLTDTKCGLIIRQIIAPAFQSGNYSKGIVDAVFTIKSFVLDENVDSINTSSEPESSPASTVIVIIFMLFYFFVFTGSLSRKFKFLRWLPWYSLFKGSSSSHYSSHSSNHFGGSGFGGGGFSGGGGSFGGGGASGGW